MQFLVEYSQRITQVWKCFYSNDHCPIIPFSLQLILIFKLILDFWKEKHNQGMNFKFNFATIYLFMEKAKLMTRLAPSNVNYQWHTRLQFFVLFLDKNISYDDIKFPFSPIDIGIRPLIYLVRHKRDCYKG